MNLYYSLHLSGQRSTIINQGAPFIAKETPFVVCVFSESRISFFNRELIFFGLLYKVHFLFYLSSAG